MGKTVHGNISKNSEYFCRCAVSGHKLCAVLHLELKLLRLKGHQAFYKRSHPFLKNRWYNFCKVYRVKETWRLLSLAIYSNPCTKIISRARYRNFSTKTYILSDF